MSGQEAIKVLKQRSIDGLPMYGLILLDYSMPEKDGPQTAISICDFCTEQEIPKPYICCVTAYSEAHFKRNALAAGMDNFIVKPI